MTLFVAADHRGFEAKQRIIEYLQKQGHTVEDVGDANFDPNDDFPLFALAAAHKVLEHTDARAILVCGSGQGMVMAANRLQGIRAGLGWSRSAAKGIRNDEDSNVIALPAEIFEHNKQLFFAIIDDFLQTPFAGAPRYIRRNQQLDKLR